MNFEEFTPQASPIPLLDAITNLVPAARGDEGEGWDLMRDDVRKSRATHSTVGLRLAL
jgi:hypothetical protein